MVFWVSSLLLWNLYVRYVALYRFGRDTVCVQEWIRVHNLTCLVKISIGYKPNPLGRISSVSLSDYLFLSSINHTKSSYAALNFFLPFFSLVATVPSSTVATVATFFLGFPFVLFFSFYIYIVILTQQIS